jgi:hypothetical protein
MVMCCSLVRCRRLPMTASAKCLYIPSWSAGDLVEEHGTRCFPCRPRVRTRPASHVNTAESTGQIASSSGLEDAISTLSFLRSIHMPTCGEENSLDHTLHRPCGHRHSAARPNCRHQRQRAGVGRAARLANDELPLRKVVTVLKRKRTKRQGLRQAPPPDWLPAATVPAYCRGHAKMCHRQRPLLLAVLEAARCVAIETMSRIDAAAQQ